MQMLSHVFSGSPAQVSPGSAIAIARDQCKPLYKARRISLSSGLGLGHNEILITYKRLETNAERAMALAELGCGEEVLVVEGLGRIEDQFDISLESMVRIADYRADCEHIFLLSSKGSIKSLHLSQVATTKKMQGKKLTQKEEDSIALHIGGRHGGICKFVHGLMLAAEPFEGTDQNLMNLHGAVQQAVKRSGGVVFKAVLESVVGDQCHMMSLLSQPRLVLAAWNEVFRRRLNRNIKSHPFLMINSDAETAQKALAAFEFLIERYPTLKPLMQVSIPLIADAIKAEQQKQSAREVVEKSNIDVAAKLLGLDM